MATIEKLPAFVNVVVKLACPLVNGTVPRMVAPRLKATDPDRINGLADTTAV
jgi:hypothetical protein